jgi:hypothetical protein
VIWATSPASAQDDVEAEELDDDGALDIDEEFDKPIEEGPAAQLGVGPRIRFVFMPTGLLNLFLDESTPMKNVGFGAEIVRRKDDFDIVVGVEYENISPEDGLYLEKGDTPGQPGENPDLTEFDGFALLGVDATFIWNKPLTEFIAFRYGAGFGIGVVLGDIIQTDTECTSSDLDTCVPTTDPDKQIRETNEDIPPVVPIVNLLVGARINAADKVSINVDAGFRNMFYIGITADYFF